MARKKLPPTTPGEVLLEEFLKPLEISQYQLAKDVGVPPDDAENDSAFVREAAHEICRPLRAAAYAPPNLKTYSDPGPAKQRSDALIGREFLCGGEGSHSSSGTHRIRMW